MVKVGRNDPCLCGSGLKYKKCCLARQQRTLVKAEEPAQQAFVNSELARLREHATARKASFRLVGALTFFSTQAGDAWMLELIERDAVQVARGGEPLAVTVNETEDTFEIGWTHGFAIKKQLFETTSYLDNTLNAHPGYPVREIREAAERLHRNHSHHDLASIRIEKP